MTYQLIYDKFLIEYDKAGVSSSYPSLTQEEIYALLDKAMLALIAQKVTGNNPRKALLDIDTKAMSDIQPLFNTVAVSSDDKAKFYDYLENNGIAKNEILFPLKNTGVPMYLLGGQIEFTKTDPNSGKTVNMDFMLRATVLSSIVADKFRETDHNKPWLKSPIMFLRNDNLHILLDSKYMDRIRRQNQSDGTMPADKLYIKVVMLDIISKPTLFSDLPKTIGDITINTSSTFILSDTMCEELINLAVIFACKNVENPRLTTEIQTKSLEA